MSVISPDPQPTDLETAVPATRVYELEGTAKDKEDEDNDKVWERVPNKGHDDPSGFRAAVFKRRDSEEYVLAFAGTDVRSGADWRTNIGQALGANTRQYELAVKAAREFQKEYGGTGAKLWLTGHSLGGAEATVAAAVTGLPAVTFNAAGVHDNTLKRNGVNPEAFRKIAEAGLIRNYVVEGDILDLVNGATAGAIFSPATKAAIEKTEETVSGIIKTGVGKATDKMVKRHVSTKWQGVAETFLNGVVEKVADGTGKMVGGVLHNVTDRALSTPLTPTAYGARIDIQATSPGGIFPALNKHGMDSVKQGMENYSAPPAYAGPDQQKVKALAFKKDPAQAASDYPELAGAQKALVAVHNAGLGKFTTMGVALIQNKLVQQIAQGKPFLTEDQARNYVRNTIKQGLSLGP